jgi:hypothetical protein
MDPWWGELKIHSGPPHAHNYSRLNVYGAAQKSTLPDFWVKSHDSGVKVILFLALVLGLFCSKY